MLRRFHYSDDVIYDFFRLPASDFPHHIVTRDILNLIGVIQNRICAWHSFWRDSNSDSMIQHIAEMVLYLPRNEGNKPSHNAKSPENRSMFSGLCQHYRNIVSLLIIPVRQPPLRIGRAGDIKTFFQRGQGDLSNAAKRLNCTVILLTCHAIHITVSLRG